MEQLTEREILEQIGSHATRQAGFVALMRRYEQPLYWHIRRLVVVHQDAQDVLQEAFINVYKYIDKFKGDSSLKTWIYKIATNEAIRHFKRRRLETSSYDEKSRIIELFEADKSIDFSSMEAQLQRAILALPSKQRVVFNLRYYDELSYEDIAEITESSVATLKTNYHYATTKIKEYMLNQMEQ